MSKHNDVKGFYGQQKGYKGPLLGVCVKCNASPKMQRNKKWATYRVICTRCDMKTIDYGNIELAATAWNGKNKRKLGE